MKYLFWSTVEKAIIRLVFNGSMMNMVKKDMHIKKRWKGVLWKVNQKKILSKR